MTYYQCKGITLHQGDCLDVMRRMDDNSVDSVITDPPYALEFMGKGWDKVLPPVEVWQEALRVAKPGAMLLAFGGTRTYHRLTCTIEDAGWQIRDCIMWIYGSGFPKSHNISKAIDKAAGAEREVVEEVRAGFGKRNGVKDQDGGIFANSLPEELKRVSITAPATEAARTWDGYGTALKPAYEPIVVAMKPVESTFAANAQKWGVAGLNIDGARVGTDSGDDYGRSPNRSDGTRSQSRGYSWGRGLAEDSGVGNPSGRWPANIIHDGSPEVVGRFPVTTSGARKGTGKPKYGGNSYNESATLDYTTCEASTGSAARFFYTAKASKSERTANGAVDNKHPTVKPLALLEYLCTLTKTPTGGVVLDPFVGSGTTLLAARNAGRSAIGIEMNAEYCQIARARLKAQPNPEARQLSLIEGKAVDTS